MADNLGGYLLIRAPRDEIEYMQRSAGEAAAAAWGRPLCYHFDGQEWVTWPTYDPGAGRLDIRGDQVFYVPTPKMSATDDPWRSLYQKAVSAVAAAHRKEHPAQISVSGGGAASGTFTATVADGQVAQVDLIADENVPCNNCGQRGLHACEPPPPPTIFNRIVSMVEFKGRLYVATERGVFVKIEDTDTFVELEFVSAKEWNGGGRAADEAAGLVPLHPRQIAERSDPFVPNRFGEHG